MSPEILFDQGVGDLFVVRVAGNVIGEIELDSIEYAALYLGSVCVVVLGHENCGAVKAVVDGQTKDIESIAKIIEPAVQTARKNCPDQIMKGSIQANACRMKDLLLKSTVIKKLASENKMQVRAAYYELNTGVVHWLD